MENELIKKGKKLFENLKHLDLKTKIETINELKSMLHQHSPFINEPVDCVKWVHNSIIKANDYNPNKVAPPEMKLLERSISEDGYTQPIVAWMDDGMYEVVDGFHRNRVGKESKEINTKIHGYLPVTIIRNSSEDKKSRIASTIRHNRARGKHTVDGMSDIVLELKNRNWKNERICRELGMEEDEVLRLCQITGLTGLFSDQEFSKSWDVKDSDNEFIPLTDDIDEIAIEAKEHGFRTVNTGDSDRIFHTHDNWECYKAGFYKTTMDGMTKDECEKKCCEFLSDTKKFTETLKKVTTEWVNSCEHYLIR